MKKYIFIIGFLLMASLAACNKFLEVTPEDKFLSDQLFRSEATINGVLNGIYINIAKPALYGRRMGMGTVDILAQYYRAEQTSDWLQYATYNYADQDFQTHLDGIWSASYTAVLNANSFIRQLSATDNTIIAEDRKRILLGEAYAMRAYLQFDMLRLFGPVYLTDSTKIAIPYLSMATPAVKPLLPARAVVDSVMADLKRAEVLLENDPVRTGGITSILNTDDPAQLFYKLRNRRFNYYAVRAIQARVQLYRGDRTSALATAISVIGEGSKWFPWSPDGASLPGSSLGPDRMFSSEVILGVQNYDMYRQQDSLFNVGLTEPRILAPTATRLSEVYENNENDYRLRVNWVSGASGGKNYKVFVKYADVGETFAFRNFQPMLRLSELYYIAAECDPVAENKLRYLNTVRQHRGLTDLAAGANIPNELYKEYRKEFWGEGQAFFYFKRTGRASLSSGTTTSTVIMNAAKYVVPLPLSETVSR
ncbi:RagB/SusD family nutrient uptake outer membrane protein [Pedobacter sp. AW31-3R]|uniref:RagB/SusD family nutrient uptake outer membrane protein n=1 Tax=Pedobacter sp. AW31-3R TaxID=3445781 RepID=UPI003F9F14F3